MKQLQKYKKYFSYERFANKVAGCVDTFGQKGLYTVLLLFYALKHKDTPLWAKNVVIGVLGYVISPFDAISDFTPFIGYTDDMSLAAFGLVAIASYINDEVRYNARREFVKWFPKYDEATVDAIDEKL